MKRKVLSGIFSVLGLLFLWSVNMTAQDMDPPVFDQMPFALDIIESCADDVVVVPPTATDNVGVTNLFVTSDFTVPGICENNFIRNITYRAEDAAGLFSLYNISITVSDFTPPVFQEAEGALNQTVSCGDALTPLVAPTATDNCTGVTVSVFSDNTVASESCGGNYVRTIVYEAEDICGNSSFYTVTQTAQDDIAPVFNEAPGALDFNVSCMSEVGAITPPTVTDNCSDVFLKLVSDNLSGDGTCSNSQRVLVYEATDDCGNSSTYTTTIGVSDQEPPTYLTAVGALDVTLDCNDADGIAAAVANGPQVADNCGGATVAIIGDETVNSGACAVAYTRTITYQAQDACGNVAAPYTVTITVADNGGPTWSTDLGVLDASLSCGTAIENIPIPTATDQCSDVTVSLLTTNTIEANCGGNFQQIYTYQAVDACGNASAVNYTVTITYLDDIAPMFVEEAGALNTTLDCSEVSSLIVPVPSATDNCSDVQVMLVNDETIQNESCLSAYVRTMTYQAVDACGNISGDTYDVVINVSDQVSPVFSDIPETLSLKCGEVPELINPQVTDNCDVNIQVVFDETTSGDGGACAGANTITRTWTAIDACGNSTVATQTINISDNTAPVIIGVPENTTVNCGVNPAVPMIEVTDDCDGDVNLVFNETVVQVQGQCPTTETILRSWIATDACDNSSVASYEITVIDTIAPVFNTIPQNTVVGCGALPEPPIVTATDACGTVEATVTYEQIINGTDCPYTVSRVWTATDICGNENTITQTLTVSDDEPPQLAGIPLSVTVSCDAIPTLATPTATDNCTENVPIEFNETETGTGCERTITRVWTAIDACGNTDVATQIITVSDNVAPVISGSPIDITVSCGSIPAASTFAATDNCDENIEVDFNETTTGSGCNYTLTRVWTATDACGNSDEVTQLIIVVDNVPPTFTFVPANVNISCGETPVAESPTATDDCADEVALSMTETVVEGNCTGSSTILRTWTATDACNNTATAVQSITINDTEAPTFVQEIGSLDISVCADDLTTIAGPTAIDNCTNSEGLIVSSSDQIVNTNGCDDQYAIVRNWTATDACNNTGTFIQTIQVFSPINATIMGSEEGCEINITSYCTGYMVSWEDDLGNTGTNPIYTPAPNTEGTVAFTLTNIYAPEGCNTATFTGDFNCSAGCPILLNATASSDAVCSGDSFSLNVQVANEDGGTLSWTDSNGNPIVDPSAVVLENNTCFAQSRTFFVEYVPATAGCETIVTSINVTVYPQITANMETDGCTISITDVCEGFVVTWTDSFGKSEEGITYVPEAGDQGTITFTVYNPNAVNAPIYCQVLEITQDFDCGPCPSFNTVETIPAAICAGGTFSLSATVDNDNGGNLFWYDSEGNLVADPANVTISTDACDSEMIGYYAVFVPNNGHCSEITSTQAFVQVFPNITGGVVTDDCVVALNNLNLCGDFAITWQDDLGNSGTGPIYSANSGTSGNVTFTATNTMANVPAECINQDFTAVFNCGGCPVISLDADNPTEVCFGQPFTLNSTINPADGGTTVWYNEEGILLDDLTLEDLNYNNCTGAIFSYYAEYTPTNPSCGPSQTAVDYLTLYPEISPNIINNGCNISLENVCPDFEITWADTDGNIGTGLSYSAATGATGTVTFTIANSNLVLAACQSISIDASYNCVNTCPEIYNPIAEPPVLCEGQTFALTILGNNLDNGTLQWFDENDNPIADPSSMLQALNSCTSGQFGYYAAYTPANSECPTTTTDLVYVTIHPQINANIVTQDCGLLINPSCPDFEVTWQDNNGNTGVGSNYNATVGTNGTVVFTVTNTTANVPTDCRSANFAGDYACDISCPTLSNATCDPNVICAGQPFALTLQINDGDNGTLQWYAEDGTAINSPSEVLLNIDACVGGQFGYYATYTPVDALCPAITTPVTYVQVYPDITANLQTDGCSVTLVDYCTSFPVSWADSYGNTGVGSVYDANTGGNGTVTFTIENPATGAPVACQSNTFTGSFNCVACPQVFNATCNPSVICAGQTFSLTVGVNNQDGGTLQWYSEDGTPVNTTEDILLDIDACTGGQFGYYAEYTPVNATCPTATTSLAYVQIYPAITATPVAGACAVTLEDVCENFEVTWSDNTGNTGTGITYEGNAGASGTVTYTVTNTDNDVPVACQSNTFIANYSCPTCPEISNASCNPPVICAGETFGLTMIVENQDGGTVQWYTEDGTLVNTIDDIYLNVDECTGGQFGYYAVYTPANGECGTVTSNVAYVQIYPQITGNVQTGGNCEVTLEDYCENFEVSWSDTNGNSGTGSTYQGAPSENGNVTFTVTNTMAGVPNACQSNSFEGTYSCPACPEIFEASCNPAVICEGQPFSLMVGTMNLDGGTLQWYTEDGTAVNTIQDIYLEINNCVGGQFGYYAEYTPENGNCPTVTTNTAYVQIYPAITAEAITDESACMVTLENYCADFTVGWQDANGNTGTGNVYNAASGEEGMVTFTVTNPGVPLSCNSNTFTANYACGSECPSLVNAACNPGIVCEGASFSLTVGIIDYDGGVLQWYDQNGTPVDQIENIYLDVDNCDGGQFGYYATYTPVGSCEVIQTEMAFVQIYPEVMANVTTVGEGCEVMVEDYCENFTLTWSDTQGNTGTGATYNATPGESGTVTFTLTNPTVGVPDECKDNMFTANYGCGDCPQLFNAACNPPAICEGETFSLTVGTSNLDGGTLQWLDESGNVMNTTDDILISMDACTGGQFGYYAQYVPTNGSCGMVVTEMAYVDIYPNITANTTTEDCTVNLTDVCTDFVVNWSDTEGNTGAGTTYNAASGSNGNVTFTVNNPNAPANCQTNTFVETYSCAAIVDCPTLGNPSISNTAVCSGTVFSLAIDVVNGDGGTLQWFDGNNNPVANPNNVVVNTNACTMNEASYYAVYNANNGDCTAITSNTVSIEIYPAITATTTSGDCVVTLDNVCENFNITWSDSNGGSGTGTVYNAATGTNGTVTWSVTNPNAPASCNQGGFIGTYNCADEVCPQIFNPVCSPAAICAGETFSLSVGTANLDNGTLQWYDAQGNPINTTTDILLNIDACTSGQFGYYAEYTPSNSNCAVVTTETTYVQIYPNITANVSGGECSVSLNDYCPNFTVSWTDTNGNNGTGGNYTATAGTSGNVTFTVANTGAANNCNEATFIGSYACADAVACPTLGTPTISDNAVCSGSTVSLNIDVFNGDGGSLQWFDLNNNPINNPNSVVVTAEACANNLMGFYAVYTATNGDCTTINSASVSVNVFPAISATVNNSDCLVSLADYCSNYNVSWSDSDGNTGNGGTYVAATNTSGSVEFTITNTNAPNAPSTCGTATFTGNYNCAEAVDCPIIGTPAISTQYACGGDVVNMGVEVTNGDGGTLVWYDSNGNIVATPNSMTLENNTCEAITYQFYAVYTPSNGACPALTSATVSVEVYPTITYDVIADGCTIELINVCENFWVNWISSSGKPGEGLVFIGDPGEAGYIEFTIYNPNATTTGIPFYCQIATVTYNYECDEETICPSLSNPTINNSAVCSGDAVSLDVTVNNGDGGTVNWFYADGTAVNNPNNVVLTNTTCEAITYNFNASYDPVTETCNTITSNNVTVVVYPQIEATPTATECTVSLENYCNNFNVTWTTGNDAGAGDLFTATAGQNGTITFTVTNLNAPTSCQSQGFTANYACAEEVVCPTLGEPTVSNNMVCSGSTVSLNVNVFSADGGVTQWFDANNTPIANPNNVVVTTTNCGSSQNNYYATYTPANNDCATITSNIISVTVYPAITANVEVNECIVDLDDFCIGYNVTWETSNGASGVGDNYFAGTGENGTITFTVTNPNAPTDCQSQEFTANYACAAEVVCPSLNNPSISDNAVCSGGTISLDITVNNNDGGSVQWFDLAGNLVNPNNETVTSTNCSGTQMGYYATYTPTNTDCATQTSSIVYVTIYPEITANVSSNDCVVNLTDYCSNYNVTWTDSDGNSGMGATYVASSNSNGNVTFTVVNSNAPSSCNQDTFSGNYNCVEEVDCPILGTPIASTSYACGNDVMNLNIDVINNDGGSLVWFDANGNPIADPSNVALENNTCDMITYSFYATYTPANAQCPTLTSTTVSVDVYPTITYDVVADGCTIELINVCENFWVNWLTSGGKPGEGTIYTGDAGEVGYVEFTIYNPAATQTGIPFYCQLTTVSYNYDCGECPSLYNEQASNSSICSNESISLEVEVANGDGGNITWYDANDVPVTDPNNVTLTNTTNCGTETYVFYATYTPANENCTTVVSNNVFVQVYPDIKANVDITDCTVDLDDYCVSFSVTWFDTNGNSGTGDNYTATAGTNGTVTFTVTNPNAPAGCQSESFTGNYACAAEVTCPTLGTPTISDNAVCSGSTVSLAVDVFNGDGGNLQWYDLSGNAINGNVVAVSSTNCSGSQEGFYAEYTPSSGDCSPLNTGTVFVTVYPAITATVELTDCTVDLDDFCSGYNVTWTDSNGGSGTGDNYTATTGTNGTVTFTVTNQNAPAGCQSESFTGNYACAAEVTCPTLGTPTISDNAVCSGSTVSLAVDVFNGDGGNLQWYDLSGNAINGNVVAVSSTNCSGGQEGFYAEYTPSSGDCSPLNTGTVFVTVYPAITATVELTDCTVDLDDFCSGYNVTWTDSNGGSGTGDNYTATAGTNGTVTFTVTNPNAPAACQSESFTGNYACAAEVTCPSLGTPTISDNAVCSGSTVDLNVNVFNGDGGTVQWYDLNGNAVNENNVVVTSTNCDGSQRGFYAEYTSNNSDCSTVSSNIVYVTVYPAITAELNVESCLIDLDDFCSGYDVTWTTSNGTNGTGDNYFAEAGETGTVTFTVTNPNAPAACQSENFTANFACDNEPDNCPQLFDATCNPGAVCNGEAFNLYVNVENQDGGTIQWYDLAGNPITNTSDIEINVDDCNGGQFGYYATYTPSNSDCPTVTSATAYVEVYPEITANTTGDECIINLVDYCETFTVVWEDTDGNMGVGSTYQATGGDGVVSFTISNDDAPLSCNNQVITAAYNCPEPPSCPELNSPLAVPAIICSNDDVSLQINIVDGDGGSLQWYDTNGNPVNDPNSVTLSTTDCNGETYGFYAVYTPNTGNCTPITSLTTLVQVHPSITADIDGQSCIVTLDDYCPSFEITWEDSEGNSGTGPVYEAEDNTNGSVIFTVTNDGMGIPFACQSQSFAASFDCGGGVEGAICDTLQYCTEPTDHLTICPEFCGLEEPFIIQDVDVESGCLHSLEDGNCVTYIPFVGVTEDVITITACDDNGCSTVVVLVTVDDDCDNDSPNAVDDYVSTTNGAIVIDPIGNDNDPNGDDLEICDFDQPLNGTVSLADGTLIYTPNDDFEGIDAFEYTVCDDNGGESTATIYIEVSSGGFFGIEANTDNLAMHNSQIVGINVMDNDNFPDGCNPMVVIIDSPDHGNVVITSEGMVNYEPEAGYVGQVNFTYQLCCGGDCDLATVYIDIDDSGECEGFRLPTGFSPNGDGVNETFQLKDLNVCFINHTTELHIFNRFGETVYKNQAYTNDEAWDGSYLGGEKVAEGPYYFVLKLYNGTSIIEKTGCVRIKY